MAASISVGLATTLLSPAPNASDEESKLRQLEEMRHHVHAFILRHPSLPRPIAKVVGWFGFCLRSADCGLLLSYIAGNAPRYPAPDRDVTGSVTSSWAS